ncbi:urease accessory protein UreD [Streptomyces sp. KM273126]|uniref:urease accessory protein UreD n=1 Tax=Streptomyces sp. KM273126 TaxID=2545247 RepID=UPI00103ACAF7|nr:urease accessory protein UreD [Streptomyces sp. KM273126]MBA2811193.1 urease accessory protein UreD [Streptomyces sp. KM273126]
MSTLAEDRPSLPDTSGVVATARVRADHNGRTTTLPLLSSDGPFHLQKLRPRGDLARVDVIGAMSGPLGGDQLALHADVGPHARLEITAATSTIALRGPSDDAATYDIRLTVGDDAALHWLPQPLISTAGSILRQTCTVDLAPTARLVLRDEQVLGRTGETCGHLTTRLTVLRAGRPLLDQHTSYGHPHPAWNGPAVVGSHRACGQLLVVDPSLTPAANPPVLLGNPDTPAHGALVPLAGPALLATVVADTATRLRHLLDQALHRALTP